MRSARSGESLILARMPIFELTTLLLLGAGCWFWIDGLRAREAAVEAARQACWREGWQLLDETVCLSRLRTTRDEDGRRRWLRTFEFEYSDTGDNRRRGWLSLIGQELSMLHLERQERALSWDAWDGGD